MAGSGLLDPFVEMMGGTKHSTAATNKQQQQSQQSQSQQQQQQQRQPTKRQASAPARRHGRSGTGRRVASAGPPAAATQMRGNGASRRPLRGENTVSFDDESGAGAGRLRPLRAVQSAKERRADRPGSATPTMETYTRELFGDAVDTGASPWTPRIDQIDELGGSTEGSARAPLRPSATINHTFTQNVGMVKPMESGIDLGAPDAHSLSLLRTHELEMERVMGTIEVLRRACDDERAAKKEAQTEAQRLRTEMATMAKGRDGDTRQEDKLRRRVAQLEKQLDLTKSKYSTSCEHARELSNGLADSQRDRRQLEKACRRSEELLKRSETERAELTAQLREATQARHSLASRLEKVVPAYAAAKENWGQQKRELVRHVEHYRKASLRSHAMHMLPQQEGQEHEAQQQQRYMEADELQQEAEAQEEVRTEPESVGESQGSGTEQKQTTDVIADYAMTKDPNYQLMSYVNELVLENQRLKQLATDQRGNNETSETGTDMSQDVVENDAATCTAGTQTPRVATVDLTAAASSAEDGAEAVDANLLLEQLQQQLEEQLAREQSAAAEQQQAEEDAVAAEAELDSIASAVVSSAATEAVSESAAQHAAREVAAASMTAVREWERQHELPSTPSQETTEPEEDPYTSPEEDDEESEEEQEHSAEADTEYYSRMLSADSSCASPEQRPAAPSAVAPTPPAGGKQQQQQQQPEAHGQVGRTLLSPPVSAPRAPAVGRTEGMQQKQLDAGATTAAVATAGVLA